MLNPVWGNITSRKAEITASFSPVKEDLQKNNILKKNASFVVDEVIASSTFLIRKDNNN